MYKACIFDLDGTLANTLRSIAGFSNRALRECGYPEISTDSYRHIVGNGVEVQLCRMMDTVCPNGWPEAERLKVRNLYEKYYGEQPLLNISNYPGVPQLLQELKSHGIKTAVLSNKPDEWTQPVIAGLFSGRTFDAIRGKRDGVPCKPAPDGALLLAKELGVTPAQCLYIGDTATDMQTGSAAGMDTAGVLWGFRDRAELESAGAHIVISDPAQILDAVLHGLPKTA
ncbi:MAG: HAD family hydrolase [Oscillospiraceae bacterium]|nr:HAD family hydrolase [Oscillospiraceae bacterium]